MVKHMTHRKKSNTNKNHKLSSKKRHTRKMAKGASDWNKKVMELYRDMKNKNPLTKLGDAMKRASQLKKKGQL